MILNLQILRAIAAVLVILAHLKFVLPAAAGQLPELLHGAGLSCGVDLFFVLSGFVIAHTALKSDPGWKQFLTNRIIRVMPLYWLATLPFLIPAVTKAVAKGDLPFRTIWNSIFLVPVLDKLGINDPAHPFGWTLSFEMWFYVLFSLLLVALPARKVPWALIAIFAVSAPLPFLWKLSWKFPYFAFHPMCWEFAMGCGAYLLTRKARLGPKTALAMLVLGTGLLLSTALLFEYLGWHNSIRMVPVLSAQRALFWGVPAFLIVVSCVWCEPLLPKRNPVVRLLVELGAASYAIYLVQPLVFRFLRTMSAPLGSVHWLAGAVACTLLCCAAGWVVHRLVELPLTAWLRSTVRRREAAVQATA
ncbi:acyltransferase family protein [Luteolibacter luteus]|uniref:Acyltransferase n=1 Tax=Luteolibacter luteus TaxID=2728835 RepID=A0A858RD89_9BACT|nr:acyltransferase [Luteolibacter luteus]QJE94280.1 acyltransferase [Luteolibacter luteus]